MKTTGIVLLSIGLLSLFGGIINPSGADTEVVIIGYIFKFALIFGGIALISFHLNARQNISLLVTKKEPKIVETPVLKINQNSSEIENGRLKVVSKFDEINIREILGNWEDADAFGEVPDKKDLDLKSIPQDFNVEKKNPVTISNIDNSILLSLGKTLLLDPKLKTFKSVTYAEQVGIANKLITDIINVDPNNPLYIEINPDGSPKAALKINFKDIASQFVIYVGAENLKLYYDSLKDSYMIARNYKIIRSTGTILKYNTRKYIDKIDVQTIIDEHLIINPTQSILNTKKKEIIKDNRHTGHIVHKSPTNKAHKKDNETPIVSPIEMTSLNNILRVNYLTGNSFDQESPWKYPLVKFPKQNCIIRSFRVGSKNRKGYKDPIFQDTIEKFFNQVLSITGNIRLNTGPNTRPYEPDIAIVDYKSGLNIRIDIEIDEPYSGLSRQATHCIGEDDRRDNYFVERGWIVVRFTEFQVHTKEIECIALIASILNSINQSFKIPVELLSVKKIDFEEQWDLIQAQKWERQKYREEYLNHVFEDSPETEGIIDRSLSTQEKKEESLVDSSFYLKVENRINSGYNKINSHHRDKRIKFYPESHLYEIDGINAVSASFIISKFFPDFDPDFAIDIMAESHPLYGTERTEIKNLWKEEGNLSRKAGTLLHEQIENNFLNGVISNSKEFIHFLNFKNDNILLSPYRTEWRIFDDNYQIAGTIDLISQTRSGYDLFDWKRSTKVINNFDNTPITQNPFQKGIGILNHIDDTSFNRYSLQQSLYRYILETNYNISINNMFLVVFHPIYDSYHKVPVPYLGNEIKDILRTS